MSKIIYVEDGLEAEITIPIELLPEFKHMLFRAFNTWQDPSPEMRDFYERLIGRTNMYPPNPKS